MREFGKVTSLAGILELVLAVQNSIIGPSSRWTMAALYTSGVDQPRSPQVCFPGAAAA